MTLMPSVSGAEERTGVPEAEPSRMGIAVEQC